MAVVMNGDSSSIRQQLVSSCNALIKFFEFVTQKGFTVAGVFSDPVLGERTRRATAVFDILSNFLNNIVKKDNHASAQLDKLILEASCVYEWTLRLFLHIFSQITPYREIENVKLFIKKIGDFLKQIQKSDVDLFDYFIREMKDLVTLLTMFFDIDRLNVKLNLTHFSSKKLALVTVKIRATEEYFEPNLEFDFSVENIEQVESLYICAVEILISIGKPFVASLGIKSACEMMSHLVTNCISFASPKMLAHSLKLFHRFYPVKCIKLDPSTGFFYQTCWLTVALFKSPTYNEDLYALVEKNWDLIRKRLDFELEQLENSVDVSKALNSIIVVMGSFHKMSPLASTKLVNESIAVVFHKLLDLCKKNQWTFPLPEDTVSSLQKLYCDKLAYSISHDSVWIALMKRVFTRNYTEIYSSSNLSFDGISNSISAIENNANRSFHSPSKTFFEDFCRANSKVISQFMNAKSLDDVSLLHNMYTVERETIASLRLDGHCLSNQGNFMKMMEVVNWICDYTMANTYDENKFKFVLSTLINTVKAIRDFNPNNVADLEQKIGFVFMIPHVAETSPLDILAHINSEWTKKHLFTNDELNILSLYGLAVANLQVTKFVSNILHAQICRWNGDDYTFNQTLTFILLKNEQLVNIFFTSIEDKENMSFIAKSIGLVTCFLSSADKGTSFSYKEPYELCDLVFHCAGCADWDNSNQKSSLPEDAECKLMELFHEIVDTKDPALLSSLGKWSAFRVLRHCGIDRSLLVSIFKLFSIGAKEVGEVLNSVFFPLIMKPIKSGSLRVPKKELLFRAFNKVFGTVRKHPENDNSIEITEINNITSLSTYFDENDLHHVLIVFFRKVWSNSSLKDHIREQMIFIARSRGLELRSLFGRYKSTICNKLINIVIDEVVPADPLQGWLYLREALMLFAASQDESALNPLFTNSLLYFFCAMVQKANDHAHALLQNFFTHSDLTAPFLTAEYGYGLPRQFVAQSSLEAVERSLKFVKKINSNEALAVIFRNDFHNSMLIEYHRNPRVAAYVVYKIYISEACSIDQENFQDTKFIVMLEAQMGPFIIALNRFLLKSGDVLEDKRLAVESLGDFLNLLGPRKVPAFKMNIMGILLTAFNQANGEKTFLKTLLKIWNQFLSSCGPNDIGPHLSVICKDLTPYFDVDPQATAKIFKRIVVENESDLKNRFRELHFLPKVSCMKEVHDVLSKYLITKSPKDPNEARDYLKENIRYFDQLFNINNPDVKALHVKKFTNILSEFKKALAYLCLPNKEASTDIIIAKIIRKLLISSQISDTNLLISIAECLGEIGAIDPGRLDLSLLSAHQISDGGFIEFTDLPVTLLSKLANTLDSIDQSRIRDCLCYSIQEILKNYVVRENDDIWSRLPTDVQRNIKRFFTTKYIFKEEGGIVDSPVFNAEITYDDWLYKWSIILIERIERVTHKKAFEACIAIIKYNSTIARFLLPTIFWMALLDSNESTIKTYIIGEINAIIEITSIDEPIEDAALMHVSSFPSPRNDTTQNRSEFNKIRLKCARTIFAIIDGIAQLKSKMFPSARKLSPYDVEMKSKIELLENNLKKTELAELAFECQAFARALLYMEDFIWKNSDALSEKLVYFQKYFLSLDEPDGVEGINAIREGPASLIDTILYHEANSELNYSLSGCEIAIKKEPDNLMYPKTLLRCLMNLDQHATAFNYATGLIQRKKQWSDAIYPYMVEASWKLHNWDDLERMLHENESLEFDSLGVNIGHLIDCVHSKDETNFRKMLREIRKREMDPLSISSSEQGAYIRCYQHILRLHMLTDIEKFAEFVFKQKEKQNDQTQNDFFNLIHDWIRRNNLVQSSLRCQEQVFNLQRVLLSLHNVLPVQTDLERAQCSLSSAKLARKSLNLQRAYTHLVESQDLINSGNLPISLAMHSSIETAKFHWAKGDQESKEHCIKELKRELEKYEAMGDLQTADRIKLSKLKLLFTKFSEKLSNLNSESLNSMYRQIIRHLNESRATGEVEEPYFCLARFSDRLMKEMEPKNPERPKLMVVVAKHYSQALKYGSKHVYESMPRLLSIWCDLGSSSAEFSKTKCTKILENNYTESCKELTDFIEKWRDSIPSHLFFTAFSQLLSRICHGDPRISENLMLILAKLVRKYPDQSMWMLIGVLMNRKNKTRADKCAEIIQKASGSDKKLTKLVRDMKHFALLLIKLCNCETQGKIFRVKNAVPELNHALNGNLGPIMLPYQAFMNVRMKNKFESSTTFSPFPSDAVYIETFDDVGEILASQARPKKVVINCSDGKKYSVMCKPKDDLRKDARTMELNNLINRLLKRDPETRKRGLHIRTYTVVPLDNDCGLIEWVKNLQSLRESIVNAKAFRYPDQIYPSNNECNTIIPKEMTKKATNEEIAKRFRLLLQKHSPPVLGEWFIQTFPDPTSWYMARLAFTRSAAVMSIVGYIIGLGDRHTENFLIDSSNGEAMHVDFNLIFNQGDLLEVPEKVPFRLTHNMVAAMGVTGYEGAFRKTCEVTLRLMREKKEALMSVLQPFVYDPLCEWKKPNPRARTSVARSGSLVDSELVEATNTKALEYVGKIEDRLDGVINKNTMSISVSGQVRYLIEEATNMANLGRMYLGWLAYY